jgi:hypothetical protein
MKTGDEPADLRLPRDLLSLPDYRKRAQTEERVQANPCGEEDRNRGSRNVAESGAAGAR